jgi:hypothetical protein
MCRRFAALDSLVLKVIDTRASAEETTRSAAELEVSACRRTMFIVLALPCLHIEEDTMPVNPFQIRATVYGFVVVWVYENEVLESQFNDRANAARPAGGAVHAVSLCAKERKEDSFRSL